MPIIGQARYDTALFLPPDGCTQAWARTIQNLRDQNDAQGNPEFSGNQSQADTLWQGEQLVRLHTVVAWRVFSKERWCARYGANSTMRTNSVVKSKFAVGDRNGFAGRGDTASVCTPLGHPTLVSQLEASWWGVNNLWQQKRTLLELWIQIRSFLLFLVCVTVWVTQGWGLDI